jgi:asparagine N-glycosylation enzyme membrane subunit Stt3
MLDMSYQALIPLFYSTSIPLGGLGFSPQQIGRIMATLGMVGGLTQIFILSRILTAVGPRAMFLASLFALGVSFACFPCMSYFLRQNGRVDTAVLTFFGVQLTAGLMLYAAYSKLRPKCKYLFLNVSI